MSCTFTKPVFLFLTLTLIWLMGLFWAPIVCCEVKDPGDEGPPVMKTGWSPFIQGGALHQFDANMDDGSRFSVNRYFIQGGMTYSLDMKRSISVALGYGLDSYDFSGDGGFASINPWKNVHTMRLSVPVRWGVDSNWSVFFVPTIRVAAESGASWGDALIGGGFAGFAYRISDRLTIGPGIGAIRQIEDTSVFPVLLIDWKITESLTLQTGRGVGATLGPGLRLTWAPVSKWRFAIGGRYEKLRFRTDKDGSVPSGIGDDRAFPLLGSVTYSFTSDAEINLYGGVDLAGKLRLEDKNGNLIAEENHDPAPVLGFGFRFRF